MGTPGVLGFIIRGIRKGTYNRWDAYPTGLGQEIVKFILSLSEEDILRMIEMLDTIEWVNIQDRVPGQDITWGEYLTPFRFGKCLRPILEGTLKHLNDNKLTPNLDPGPYEYYIDFEKRLLIIESLILSRVYELKFSELTLTTMREVEMTEARDPYLFD